MCRDLGFWNELRHFVSHPSGQVPHVTVSLLRRETKTHSSSSLVFPSILGLGTDRTVDRRHVTGIWVDVDGVHGDFRLWDQLFVVVRFQVPDVDHATLIPDNQLRLQSTERRLSITLT